LEVTHEAALDRGEHPTGAEERCQAGEQRLRPGLVGSREQLLGEARGDGICLAGVDGLGGVALGFFLLQLPPMAALAQPTGPDTVCAGRGIRPIFQPVKNGVEGAHRRRLEGGKAGDLCQAWKGAQGVGPLRETFVVEEAHEQEGPQDADRVVGRPPARAGGVERAQEGPRRVQIEAQQDEGRFVPRLGEAAGLAAQPALELGGQHGTILGMGWVHGVSSGGRKGSTWVDHVSILPPGAGGNKPDFLKDAAPSRQAP
jgi:hypothetical protein